MDGLGRGDEGDDRRRPALRRERLLARDRDRAPDARRQGRPDLRGHQPDPPADRRRRGAAAVGARMTPERAPRRRGPGGSAPARLEAPDLDAAHDPGAEAAGRRVVESGIEDGRYRAARAADRRPHPVRHRVLDRPDDDRGRRLLPARRRHGRGAARLLRLALPGRRGRRDLLRAAQPPDERAVGRADAARLHRSTSRPTPCSPASRPRRGGCPKAIREALPADAGGEGADLREGPAGRAAPTRSGGQFADGLEPLAEARPAGRRVPPVPALVLHRHRENRDAIREARDRLGRHGLRVAVEFRNATWFNEKNVERTLRFLEDERIPLVMVDGPQGFKSSRAADRRDDLARTSRSSASTAGGRRPGRRCGPADGRAVPLPVRPRRAGGVGAADPRGGRRRRATPTC